MWIEGAYFGCEAVNQVGGGLVSRETESVACVEYGL